MRGRWTPLVVGLLVGSAGGDGPAWGLWNVQIVDHHQEAQVGVWSSVAVDGAGRPHISYYDSDRKDLKYAYWNGGSWTIQTVASVGEVGLYTSLALDASGRPRISYYDSGNKDLKYAYCCSA